MNKIIFLIVSVMMCTTSMYAKDELYTTKIEALETKTSSVILEGYSEIGSISSPRFGSVKIRSLDVQDVNGKNRALGLSIFVDSSLSKSDNVLTVNVDYDEIDSILNTIDYFMKINNSITYLDYYTVSYKTKGKLHLTYQKTPYIQNFVVGAGINREVRVPLELDKLLELKQLIMKAKAILKP